eukprot:84343_1
MSTSNVQWKLDQRVKLFTSKTPTPQWITGTIIHQTNQKICIQFDKHWVDFNSTTTSINSYEWIHHNDKNIKDFHKETFKHFALPTYNSKICDKVTIPNPINDVHRIQYQHVGVHPSQYNLTHQKWNDETQQFENMSALYKNRPSGYPSSIDSYRDISNQWLIYIASMKQLFAFVATDILYCNIKCKNQTSYVWTNFGLKLPSAYHIILAFNHIAFIYPQSMHINEIYCIDLKHQKFFISNKTCVKKDNYNMNIEEINQLSEIIPIEWINIYKKTYDEPLVIGYIKKK